MTDPADGDTASPELPIVDTSRPSVARVYDLALGGKDNYEVDRAAYAQLMKIAPEVPPRTET